MKYAPLSDYEMQTQSQAQAEKIATPLGHRGSENPAESRKGVKIDS